MSRFALAIEISNPSSGPRGHVKLPEGATVPAGPSVALAPLSDPHGADTELLHEDARHDDDLMPAIDRLCRRRGARPADLARVAVSIGPGGYTSLRIAVATAKMLAEATGAETVPVPSGSAAAWCLPLSLAPAVVCLASKNDTAFGTLLPAPADSRWWNTAGRAAARALLPAHEFEALERRIAAGHGWIAASCPLGLIDAAALLALRPAAVIADRFLPEPMRAAAAAAGASVIEPIFSAESVLRIAHHTPPVDPLALAPFYPRQAEAVTQWRRRRGV